jgi:hypothetical protein
MTSSTVTAAGIITINQMAATKRQIRDGIESSNFFRNKSPFMKIVKNDIIFHRGYDLP